MREKRSNLVRETKYMQPGNDDFISAIITKSVLLHNGPYAIYAVNAQLITWKRHSQLATMSKESSFQIVSEVNLQEVDNAVNQARKEISTRYDFKGSGTNLVWDKEAIAVSADNEFHLKSAIDVLQTKIVRRGISLKALEYGKVEQASGGTVRQKILLKQGIPQEKAKAIGKLLRDARLKVNSQIEGEKLRISSKSKDELQRAIKLIRERDYNIPLQFVNFR